MDMTRAIEPRSDQLNAEDLLTGPRTFTITDVREGSAEQRVRVFLAEGPEGRPYLPNVSMCRLMVLAWGPESDAYIGQRLTLYRDPDVRFGRDQPGGIRISHMSGIRKALVANLTVTKGKRSPYTVEPLPDQPANVPTLMDQLVWAFNAAKVEKEARLGYCRSVVDRPLKTAHDLTADEVATVIAALQQPRPGGPVPGPAEAVVGDQGPEYVETPEQAEERLLAEAYERERANDNG
jgi:hypothetical protein